MPAMPESARRTLAVLVVLAVCATLLSGPAGAAGGTAREQRDEARRQRAALAVDLDALNASDDALQGAVDALTDQVRGQRAELEAARQAVHAADAASVAARAELAATNAAIAGLKQQLVAAAVESFVAPGDGGFHEVLQSGDPAEAVRRQAFVDQVVAIDTDIVDRLGAAEEDQEIARRAAEAAQAKAEERKAATVQHLTALEGSLAEQARLKGAVEDRRSEVLAEIEGLAAAEAELTALIDRRIAEAAAKAAADAARASATAAAKARASAPAPASSGPSSSGGSSSGPATLTAAASSGGSGGSGGCGWPASGPVTSGFGTRWGRLHAGIDIGAPTGAPIRAARSGTVVVAGRQGGYGNTVVIDHGGGMTTLYAHQSRLATSQGRQVGQGELIGYVGTSGSSTGPHLHFETRYDGSPRNPTRCLG